MALSSGTRLGPYEIQSALGAGGMGEVYRARDTRLGRTVAVKVLPADFSRDRERRQRFEREARLISRLSHPNICALHDVGQQDDIDYLVIEYLEGETLAQRLARGPVPVPEVMQIAAEIAAALDAAHRDGIAHRDLKPGNVVLTKHGAKLLDFGLAKATRSVAPSSDTLLTGVTELTTDSATLGTLPYMAPEQVEGSEADARSDMFALGTVLYEMLTGKRPFVGNSRASLAAAILAHEPAPVSASVPQCPPELDHLVATCLAKQPDNRWQSARDVSLQLKWIQNRKPVTAAQPVAKQKLWQRLAPWGLTALLAVAAWLAFNRPATQSPPLVRSSLLPPPHSWFLSHGSAVSPDGELLAFVAVAEDGQQTLGVRKLGAAAAQQLAGTAGAMYPFWSPDSRAIGFFAEGKLKTVEVSGGAVRVLSQATRGRGGTWNRDGVILFSPNNVGPLHRVSISGGSPVPVTRLSREGTGQAHRWPYFLPDGKHFVYFVDWSAPDDPQADGIYVASLDSPEAKLISTDITGQVEYSAGHLLFVRNRRLFAQPFDLEGLRLTGSPRTLTEQEIPVDESFSRASFSAGTGVLVFASTADYRSQLLWLDITGKEIGRVPGSGYRDPRISPDGRYLALSYDTEGNGVYSIHVYDLARGTVTRLSDGHSEFPVWSADGRKIFYVFSSGKSYSLMEVPSDGSGQPRPLFEGAKMMPNHTSPDGKYLVYMNFEKGLPFLEIYSFVDGSRRPVVQPFGAEGQISPNGKFLVHLGGGGRPTTDLFVRPFPNPGSRIQISTEGGAQARWSRDGRRIFFIALDKKLMVVEVDPSGQKPPSPARVLFQTRIVAPNFVLLQYDFMPDGKRFIVNSLPPAGTVPLTLLTGWTAAAGR